MHSPLLCTMARCVWTLSDPELVEHMMTTAEPNARNWLFSMMGTLSQEEFTRMVVTIWAIWTARPKLIHKGDHQSPLATHMFITRFLSDLRDDSTTKSFKRSKGAAGKTAKVDPPSSGMMKINVDGAVQDTTKTGRLVQFVTTLMDNTSK